LVCPRQHVPRRDGSLKIHGYDEICFPGLAAEWAECGDLRPFVGTPTLELTADTDDEVASWIAAGSPPIYFGFGSTRVEGAAAMVQMIGATCAQLGERALVCAGWTEFADIPHFDHVKVVRGLNYAATFPICRAVVHHGGAGTTAAGLRAGVPRLVLWTEPNQPFWGARVSRLKVGTQRFSRMNQERLVEELQRILAPECVARAREIATDMTKPAESVTKTPTSSKVVSPAPTRPRAK
jgi:UDP:flavonoid glycosyltransferase YjiC (YdhE family)